MSRPPADPLVELLRRHDGILPQFPLGVHYAEQGPMIFLHWAHDAANHLDDAMRLAVELARADGKSWTDIGRMLRTSKQAVQQRFAPRRPVGQSGRSLMDVLAEIDAVVVGESESG